MNKCPECGVELKGGEKFCSLCGFKLYEDNTDEILETAGYDTSGKISLEKNAAEKNVAENDINADYTAKPVAQVMVVNNNRTKNAVIAVAVLLVITAAVLAGIVIAKLLLRNNDNNYIADREKYNAEDISVFENVTEAETKIFTEKADDLIGEITTVSSAASAGEEKKPDSEAMTVQKENKTEPVNNSSDNNVHSEEEKHETPVEEKNDSDNYQQEETVPEVPQENVREEEQNTGSNNDNAIYFDNSGILRVSFDLSEYDYYSIQNYLGVLLDSQKDFPWWGNNLKNVDLNYNGLSLCLMFQNDRLVMVIHDTMSELDQSVVNSACNVFGQYYKSNGSYVYNTNDPDYYFELSPDFYAETGEIVYHQRYISKYMY